MEKTSPLTAFFLGIVIVILGALLPENSNFNYGVTVMSLGAIILLISIIMFFKNKKQ